LAWEPAPGLNFAPVVGGVLFALVLLAVHMLVFAVYLFMVFVP
jgi:hypothetical protein